MSVLNFLLLLLVAAICGSIGQALVGYSVGGCITSTIVGFIGALLGIWLAGQLGLAPRYWLVSYRSLAGAGSWHNDSPVKVYRIRLFLHYPAGH
jgi:uncharacterized membrane protein YeaQ/YmgE (transglycosylase-associated protein family)